VVHGPLGPNEKGNGLGGVQLLRDRNYSNMVRRSKTVGQSFLVSVDKGMHVIGRSEE
jgi:hypothetical protein